MQQCINADTDPWSWRWSSKRNLTRTFRGHQLTVYPDKFGRGFCWCIALNDRPLFSEEIFATWQEAMRACMAEVLGMTSTDAFCYGVS
jgi:hypothetical protein